MTADRLVLAAVVAVALAVAGCGGDDDEGAGRCPESLAGMTPAEVEEAMGRPADRHTDYGDAGTGEAWEFGDDDELSVTYSPSGRVDGFSWADGDQFMASEDHPSCPLGTREG